MVYDYSFFDAGAGWGTRRSGYQQTRGLNNAKQSQIAGLWPETRNPKHPILNKDNVSWNTIVKNKAKLPPKG